MRLIDGDALDEFLQKAEIDAEKAKKYVLRSAINTIRGNLANFPTVEPERKKGKWINHRNDDGHNIADCSECGNSMQWFDPDAIPNYCPNCGSYNGGEPND